MNKLIRATICSITILMLFSRQVNANNIILGTDDFNDGNDFGWIKQHESGTVDFSNNWILSSGMYGLKITSSFIVENSFFGENWWSDYKVSFDMLAKSGSDKNFIFRYQDRSNENKFNRWYELHISGTRAYLSKIGFGDITPSVLAPIQHGIIYNWKGTFNKNHILIEYKKFNENTYTKLFDLDDNNDPILNGKIGIRIGTGATYLTEMYFDNIVVTDLRDHLNVPHISQIDSRWSNDIYNHSPIWANSNATGIKNWGCALTSAAMVLNYYGHQTDPKLLNQYLINQRGYNNWGGVIWSYFTKFARQNKYLPNNNDLPDLEFTYPSYSQTQLESDLVAQQPDIIKLLMNSTTRGNHFVVAAGPLNKATNLIIQDPAKLALEETLLDYDYPNKTPLQLARFKPSYTDLSALWVFGPDTLHNFSVTQLGNLQNLDSNIFIDGGIKDEFSENISPFYHSFYLPKPATDSYQVSLTANSFGLHPVEIVVFDKEANDYHKTFHIYSGPELPRNINISLDPTDTQKTKITSISSIDIITKIVEAGRVKNLISENANKHILHMLNQINKHQQKAAGKSAVALINALTVQLQTYQSKGLIDSDFNQTLLIELDSL